MVHWNADSTLVVQTLAARSVSAAGAGPPGRVTMTDAVFDPTSDQFIFGFPSVVGRDGRDDETRPMTRESDANAGARRARISVRFEHPIAPGAEGHYRYRASDSLTLALPDGRSIRAVSLEFIPRESVGRLFSGILWIEPESGSLVRAVYRLSEAYDVGGQIDGGPVMWLVGGLVKPVEFNVSLVTVEYSLWDLEYWMPTRWRIGIVRAGVLRAVGTLEQSYQVLDVVSAWDAETPPDPEAVLDRWLTDDTFGRFRAVDPADRVDPYGLDDRDPGDGRAAQDTVSPEGGQTLRRNWFLGGTGTLRGYPGASAVGPGFLRGRAELARDRRTTRWALFSDWGWAGEDFSNAFDDGLLSVGARFSALDGLIRLDIARAVRSPSGWRLEFHLDSIL